MAKHTITTVETVHRTYEVEAPDEASARNRLRLFWKDPDMVREDLVSGPSDEVLQNRQVLSDKAKSQAKRQVSTPTTTEPTSSPAPVVEDDDEPSPGLE